jgi:hypothetical protein
MPAAAAEQAATAAGGLAGASGGCLAVVDDLVDDHGGVKRLEHAVEVTAETGALHREVTPT